MSERLIRTSVLCERLGMSKHTAIAVMADNGVKPICLGAGRGRGIFWLSSAVDAALLKMHENAQNSTRTVVAPNSGETAFNLADMSIDDLYNLTHADHNSTDIQAHLALGANGN